MSVLLLALYHDDVVAEFGLDWRVGVDRLGEGRDGQGEGCVLGGGRGAKFSPAYTGDKR